MGNSLNCQFDLTKHVKGLLYGETAICGASVMVTLKGSGLESKTWD
jgi:hypothetical protein